MRLLEEEERARLTEEI
ncbi:hypothetical protein ScalyP_jg5105, partial [Parmales sp. scaly parma]